MNENGVILSMSGQGWLFLSTVLAGAVVGLFYDVFRILRRTVPFLNNAFVVGLMDFLFWVAATIGIFYFMLLRNYGEIRLFSVLGAGLGAVLYFATVSRLVVRVFVVIINYLKKVIIAAFRIIFAPIRLIFGWLEPPFARLFSKARSGLCRLRRYVKIRSRKASRNLNILRKKV